MILGDQDLRAHQERNWIKIWAGDEDEVSWICPECWFFPFSYGTTFSPPTPWWGVGWGLEGVRKVSVLGSLPLFPPLSVPEGVLVPTQPSHWKEPCAFLFAPGISIWHSLWDWKFSVLQTNQCHLQQGSFFFFCILASSPTLIANANNNVPLLVPQKNGFFHFISSWRERINWSVLKYFLISYKLQKKKQQVHCVNIS